MATNSPTFFVHAMRNERRHTMLWKRDEVTLACLIGLALMLSACGGDAHADRPSGLQQEVATLRAQIAQLQSQSDYQMRLIAARPATFVVGSLCTDPCTLDSDGDGTNDCEDLCPCDPGNSDGDGDGIPDCADPCPDDGTDACIDPCRQDSDGDGLRDCEDPCPFDPTAPSDGDGDGIPDCADPCPDDAKNECGGPCPLDADGDSIKDCRDPCPFGASETRPCVPPPVPSGPGVLRGGSVRRSLNR
jgi:hypothetical protein